MPQFLSSFLHSYISWRSPVQIAVFVEIHGCPVHHFFIAASCCTCSLENTSFSVKVDTISKRLHGFIRNSSWLVRFNYGEYVTVSLCKNTFENVGYISRSIRIVHSRLCDTDRSWYYWEFYVNTLRTTTQLQEHVHRFTISGEGCVRQIVLHFSWIACGSHHA